jgi:hypothetical protein
LPSADPISRRDWPQFSAARDHSIGLLPDLHATLAKNSSGPVPDSTINR